MISCSLATGFVYVLSTAIGATVIGGGYLTLRGRTTTKSKVRSPVEPEATSATAETAAVHREMSPAKHTTEEPIDSSSPPSQKSTILDLLPEDERRILQPVLTSPGLTQIELRDRSDFSKAKVSQTVTDLEKRGLLYRESQGRTYRIYPDESLEM